MSHAREGLVVAHWGKGYAVEDAQGIFLCQAKRHLDALAVGDRVNWEPAGDRQGRIVAIQPRKSLLARPAHNGRLRPVAANLDQVLVVIAPQPPCDFLLVDQYLVVCTHHALTPLLVLNKCDLTEDATLTQQLPIYARLGYPILRVSAHHGTGLDALKQQLTQRCSILTGQSGVGKSSLTHALLPEKTLRINSLSQHSGRGRHTTTTATLYPLPDGGQLIDSPGVSIFGLAGIDEQLLAHGFREFQPFIAQCQFNDCRHTHDKGCAVRAAVDAGAIDAERYARYLKLRDKLPRPLCY